MKVKNRQKSTDVLVKAAANRDALAKRAGVDSTLFGFIFYAPH
jgi:hypothetical protein